MLAEFIGGVAAVDSIFLEGFELIEDLLHTLDSDMMFVVIAQHLEDDLQEGEEVLVGLELTQLG